MTETLGYSSARPSNPPNYCILFSYRIFSEWTTQRPLIVKRRINAASDLWIIAPQQHKYCREKSMSSQLTDRFGRHITYLRLSVTDRCDFRCVYCMAEKME